MRKLKPFKVCILGPPGVGKTTIAKQLADQYKLHHIHAKDVIAQAIDKLNKLARRADQEAEKPNEPEGNGENNEDDDEDEEEEEEEAPDLSELEIVNEQLETNNGRLDDTLVVKFFRERLMSKACQNQGFILDGYPKTKEQAQMLFERKQIETLRYRIFCCKFDIYVFFAFV